MNQDNGRLDIVEEKTSELEDRAIGALQNKSQKKEVLKKKGLVDCGKTSADIIYL